MDQLSSKVHSPPPPPCLCVDCSDQTHWSSVFLRQESDSSWFRLFMVWKGRLDCWKEKGRRERCLESAAASVVRAFFLPPVPVPQSPPMAGNLSHRQPTIARCSYVSTNLREKKWDFRAQFRDFPVISTDCNVHNICFGAQSFVHFSAQTQLCLKKLFMWFQWFIGSKLWPNNTVNTKFCVEIFLGARMSQPPQNALYHTVQMVLVDPCDKLIICFLWP